MKGYYCTNKRAKKFIQSKLHAFNSLSEFSEAVKDIITSLNDEYFKSNQNQIRFYRKVLTNLK